MTIKQKFIGFGGGDPTKLPNNVKLIKHKSFGVFFSWELGVEGGSWERIIADSLDEAIQKAKQLHKHAKIDSIKEEGDCYI